jgi:hypothetical protein
MRSNTKKNQIYEIHLRKAPVNVTKTVLLPPVRPNIQKIASSLNASPPVIEPVIDSVTQCVENDVNNLLYVKSKIMSTYGNLYKAV